MTQLHIVIGPVGAGKSTFARALSHEHSALRLTLDEWMTVLFRPDRPASEVMAWYLERSERCIEQIWRVTRNTLHAGSNVVLEIGLIRRQGRDAFRARMHAAQVDAITYVVDAPRALRRERVARRNRERGETFSMVVPLAIFELASDMWEPPTATEYAGRDLRFVDHG
jgi:predicted kinase